MNSPKVSVLLVGFLLIAFVSGWLNFKQARVVDAAGDVVSIEAEVSELRLEIAQVQREMDKATDGKNVERRKKVETLNEEIKELKEVEIPEQRQDLKEAAAALPNGAIFWTILAQFGAAAIGVGLIRRFQDKNEDSRVRGTALIVLGAITILLLLSRWFYIVSAASASSLIR